MNIHIRVHSPLYSFFPPLLRLQNAAHDVLDLAPPRAHGPAEFEFEPHLANGSFFIFSSLFPLALAFAVRVVAVVVNDDGWLQHPVTARHGSPSPPIHPSRVAADSHARLLPAAYSQCKTAAPLTRRPLAPPPLPPSATPSYVALAYAALARRHPAPPPSRPATRHKDEASAQEGSLPPSHRRAMRRGNGAPTPPPSRAERRTSPPARAPASASTRQRGAVARRQPTASPDRWLLCSTAAAAVAVVRSSTPAALMCASASRCVAQRAASGTWNVPHAPVVAFIPPPPHSSPSALGCSPRLPNRDPTGYHSRSPWSQPGSTAIRVHPRA
ncbi:hypothetical protein PLICRDRAFT_180195 [Plicaturopsis crispa FD-325 SS-3]|uniref:Uncharacterized protein n=1 Tax=Plicaturopsis crispa FD-325 SS-3 TaxID=944288 RepID=A0A0C9T2T7_PLICR|nr:hypothetical protein PLICRDRAFT_180195 [Plicaturopsis crispa FD-325 SS-3]